MKVDKVTVDMLSEMKVGDKICFELPDARACINGRSLCYIKQYTLGCKFKCRTNYVANTLTVEKLDKNAIQ